jgi:hypothetical protein
VYAGVALVAGPEAPGDFPPLPEPGGDEVVSMPAPAFVDTIAGSRACKHRTLGRGREAWRSLLRANATLIRRLEMDVER